MLTTGCSAGISHEFGTVLPNSPATTSTTTPCTMTFQSSNDSAQLRIGQKDGGLGANAMGLASPAFVDATYDQDHLTDVDQHDTNNGWAVGRDGALLQTTNGSTWTDRSAAVAGYLVGHWMEAVDIVDGAPATAFIGGNSSRLVRIDAANTGTPTYADLTARLNWGTDGVESILALSASEVIVVGYSGRVARSTNANLAPASVTFANYTLGAAGNFDIVRAAANTYYISGDSDIWKTTNGAVNNVPGDWAPMTAGHALAIAASDATHVYAAGWNGKLATSAGGAFTYRTVAARTQSALRGATTAGSAFPGTAWVAGEHGELWKTTSSGAIWTRQSLPTSNQIFNVSAVNDQILVAVGADSLIMRSGDGGATWTKQKYSPGGLSQLNAVDVDPTDGRVAVAVGGNGDTASAALIRRTTNGGASWTTIAPPTSEALFDVAFASSTVVWAVGESGTILRSANAGVTWTTQTSPTGLRLDGIAARNEVELWAVGEQGTVLSTTNGGTSWVVRPAGTTSWLQDVVVTSTGTIVIAGNDSVVRRSTDGGTVWNAATVPGVGGQVLSLTAATDTLMFAVEDLSEDISRSVDGGVTWTALGASSDDAPIDVSAIDSVVVSVGAWGRSQRSDTSGAAWTSTRVASNGALYGVALADSHTAYAVGEGGAIQVASPSSSANALVSNYAFAGSDWDTAASTSMFGVCIQDVTATTAIAAGWTEDAANVAGRCEALDTDPWAAIPATQSKVATTAGAGVVGRVDFVWGFRPKNSQAPGRYTAAVVFEALAPSA